MREERWQQLESIVDTKQKDLSGTLPGINISSEVVSEINTTSMPSQLNSYVLGTKKPSLSEIPPGAFETFRNPGLMQQLPPTPPPPTVGFHSQPIRSSSVSPKYTEDPD